MKDHPPMQRAVLLVKHPEMQLQGKTAGALFIYSSIQSSFQCSVKEHFLHSAYLILLFSQCLQAVFGEGSLWHVMYLQLQNVSI